MRFRSFSLIVVLGIALTGSLAACGGSSGTSAATQALQKQADVNAIDGIEKTWHKASSTHNVDLMMSIWAPDSTFTIGPTTLTGRAQIRDFFTTKAAPFQAANHWVSDTPAYKIRITVNGDRGTLYFECHYIDVKTQKVMSVVAADQNVQRIDGKWLITNASGASPTLTP
jgi:ketosteroid isomerase-like protein